MLWLGDVRFWILLFFLLRLYGITYPPLEVEHNWRQTTVTMVARNFVEVEANPFYPRIDIAGEKTGITGMEFPLLNYFIYLASAIFGYEHWYGRLINLFVSSIGLFYFFRLIKDFFGDKVAFNSTIVLLFSIWFSYSRKVMPDTFAMSFVIASLFYGLRYLRGAGGWTSLLFYSILMLAGVLAKLPSAFIMVIFSLPLLDRQNGLSAKIYFSISSFLVLALVGFWYFYWVPYLVQEYGFWHFFMGKGLYEGMLEIGDNLGLTLERFYATAIKYVGFGLFIFGLLVALHKRDKKLIWTFSLSLLAFIPVMFKAGYTFPHHSYYIIPFVPVMALVCGYGIAQIPGRRWAVLCLIALGIEGVLNQQHDFRISTPSAAVVNLERDLDLFSRRSDLILINSGQYPTPMYFAHRKGWVAYNEQVADEAFIQDRQRLGLKYIVVMRKVFGTELALPYPKVLETDDYFIYQL